MSKKSANNVPSTAVVDAPPAEPSPSMANVNVEEAVRRFNPFVFTLSTDTQQNVDFTNTHAAFSRDATMGSVLYTIDRAETVQWFAGLTNVSDPALAATVAEVKAQATALSEAPTVFDASLVSACVKHKIVVLAMEREAARLEEVEVQRQQHEELVERLMDEGLTRREAQKAAVEEEEALRLAEEGMEGAGGVEVRTMAFVHLKGFPITAEHVMALFKVNVVVNSILNINSLARFGKKDEVVAVDPKAKGKGKPEVKKADPKKGGKGGKDDTSGGQVESLAASLSKERAKIPVFEHHPFSAIYIWTYDVATAESTTAVADDPATSGAVKVYDLQETEAEVIDKVVGRVVQMRPSGTSFMRGPRQRQNALSCV